MRILFTADYHIKISKDIPQEWQRNRLGLLTKELNRVLVDKQCDLHIIGGDILDVAKPSTEEMDLYFDTISNLQGQGLIFTGNHELYSKTKSCLFNLADETVRCNPNYQVIGSLRTADFDVIDYVELKQKEWSPKKSDLCFTHVRGAIPPHVKPEINLNRFEEHGYKLVIAGDLHSYQCSQEIGNIRLLYPGSPFSTSYSRNLQTDTHGYLIVDTDTLEVEWGSLDFLPQLLLKSVESVDDMIPDSYHRVMYELVGDVIALGKSPTNELLKKKVNKMVGKEAKLQGLDGNIGTEVSLYCKNILGLDKEQIKDIITTLHDVVPNLEDFND